MRIVRHGETHMRSFVVVGNVYPPPPTHTKKTICINKEQMATIPKCARILHNGVQHYPVIGCFSVQWHLG
jgi:hypothetical protein